MLYYSSAGTHMLCQITCAQMVTSARATLFGSGPRGCSQMVLFLAESVGLGQRATPELLEGQAQPGEQVPEFDADWGLETLVNVGEHWITSLLQVVAMLS